MYRRVLEDYNSFEDGSGRYPYYRIMTENEGGDLCIGTVLDERPQPRYYFNIGFAAQERPIDVIHNRLCPGRDPNGRCCIRTATTVDAAQQAIIDHYETVMDAYVREALAG